MTTHWEWTFAVILLAGCGRTELLDIGLDKDAAPDSSQSSQPECNNLRPHGAALTIEGEPFLVDTSPRLLHVTSGNLAILTFMRGANTIGDLMTAAFDPWPSWPQSLAASYTPTSVATSGAYRVGSSDSETFPLLLREGKYWGEPVFRLLAFGAVFPGVGAGNALELDADDPLYIDMRSDGTSLTLFGAKGRRVFAQMLKLPNGGLSGARLLACSPSEPLADAVRFGDGWLVAVANKEKVLPANCELKPPFLERIDFLHVATDGELTPIASLDGLEPVSELHLAPREDGAFLVYRDSSGLRWSTLDVSTGVIDSGHELALDIRALPGFDVVSVDEHLVIVSTTGSELDVTVVTAELVHTTTMARAPTGPVTSLAAPDRSGVLAAWKEFTPNGNVTQIAVARFDCD